MKSLFPLIGLLMLTACSVTSPPQATDNPEGRIVESAILWEAKMDSSWTPLALEELVQNTDQFEKEGSFYKVRGDLVVFGQQALYVGMLGVEMLPGPNAFLQGSPLEVADYITKHHGIKFKKYEVGYGCDYKDNIKLLIGPHPTIEGASIVIGAYVGP